MKRKKNNSRNKNTRKYVYISETRRIEHWLVLKSLRTSDKRTYIILSNLLETWAIHVSKVLKEDRMKFKKIERK